jgi:hypothetical protein
MNEKNNNTLNTIMLIVALLLLCMTIGVYLDPKLFSDNTNNKNEELYSENKEVNDNDVNIDNSNTENVNENYSDVITAYQISSDYESNEVAADLKYRDKIFRVSGVVEEISRSFTEKMIVSLEGYNYREINCIFSEEHINIISKLYKGQSIIIEGKCSGKTFGSVFLQDCLIE